MTTTDPMKQTLAQLGVGSPDRVASLFEDVRRRFDEETSNMNRVTSDEGAASDALRLSWLGRKAGVLTLVTNNWLKTAPPELKPAVGQELNKLKAYVESALNEHLRNLQASAEKSAAARDKIDLSLPGIERAFGTRHLIRQKIGRASWRERVC